jgi:hypothetical protein
MNDIQPALPPTENVPSISSSAATQNSKLRTNNSSINSRRRRSAIARLPKPLRDQINLMLDDGLPYPDISKRIADNSGLSISADSISRWKQGGYQDYLRELRLLEESRQRYELILDLAREKQGIEAFQAARKIAAAIICDAVAEIGADSLREAVKLNPLNFLRMLNCLSRLTTGGLKCERHLLDQADREVHVHKQNQSCPKKGISPGTIKEMENTLSLM